MTKEFGHESPRSFNEFASEQEATLSAAEVVDLYSRALSAYKVSIVGVSSNRVGDIERAQVIEQEFADITMVVESQGFAA